MIFKKREITVNSVSSFWMMLKCLRGLPLVCTWLVTVEIKKGGRTAAQNRLMWTWITDISEVTGQSKESIHRHFKLTHLVPILIRDDHAFADIWASVVAIGNTEATTKLLDYISTTDLKVKEFTEYLREYEEFAFQRGIHLRSRDDTYYQAMGIRR